MLKRTLREACGALHLSGRVAFNPVQPNRSKNRLFKGHTSMGTPSATAIEQLTPTQRRLVWQAGYTAGLISEPCPDEIGYMELFVKCQHYDAFKIVTTLAKDPSVDACMAVEKLLSRPITRVASNVRSLDLSGKSIVRTPTSSGSPTRVPAPRPTRSDHRVVLSLQPNPKKPGSAAHARYEHYAIGRTVDDLLKLGLTKGDLDWDTKRGFVSLGIKE